MKTLTILYDSKCGICRRIRVWLAQQDAYVPLVFVPLQDEFVEARFPGIGALKPDEQLIAISDTGEVWRGVNGWIMTLWALREYRNWSFRMANPLLKPFARSICHGISQNRRRISQWIFGNSPETAARILGEPECAEDTCASKDYGSRS